MCKFIKKILFLTVTALIVFFVVALWSGGDKFRWFGEKTGGAIKESGEKLGKSADEIKKEKDKAAETIKKLTGGDEAAVDSEQDKQPGKKHKGVLRETAKEDIKEPDAGSGKEDGDKTAGNSQHTLWDSIMEKIRALTKG
jgi:Sec-independent protein translocase protein TatA